MLRERETTSSIETTSSGGGIKEFRVDRFDNVELDPFVLGFTLLVSVSTSVLFGLAPALQASRLNLNEALKEEGRGSTDSAGRHRVRNFLLVSEVSMAMLLVVWAGLTVQSFRRVMDIDLGFASSNVMTATIDPDVASRMYDGNRHQLIRQIIDNVVAVPGVKSAAVVGELGTRRSGANGVLHIDGQPEVPVSELPTIDGRAISPSYFETMGIPLLSGRNLSEDDNLEAPQVVLVNESAAKQFFPNVDPVGQKIITGHPAFPIMNQPRREIVGVVGVVGDVRTFSTESEVQPEVFSCYLQKNPRFWGGGETVIPFLIRTRGEPLESINAIRFAIEGDGSSGRILGNVDSMGRLLNVTAGQHRFRTLLMSLFAGLALLLATVGIYGVMSYGVSQRTHEIGVRMALGAQSSDVLKMIIGSGMKLCFVGIAIGLGLAIAGGHLLASMLYGIEPLDPPTLIGVSVVLALTGFLACYIPARRALRIHPMDALRYE
jgi:predicted permease